MIKSSVDKEEMLHLVDANLLKKKLADYQPGDTGFIYIIDKNGKIILQPEGKQHISSQELFNSNMNAFLKQVKAEPEGTFIQPVEVNGKTVVEPIAYKHYDFLNWTVATGISDSELNQSTTHLYGSLITAVICVFLIIASLIFVLTIRHRKQIIAEKKDYLTGLDNRRCFMELAQVVEQTSSNIYSIVLFDIDKFKNVNDTYGHAEGDEVIREVTHVLKQFESPNVFVSRHGGEEFILLLNDLNEIEAKAIAEDIRIRISKISSLKCRFTISGGVFEADSDKHNLNEAIAFADEGLYVAKQSGRNQIVIKHVS
ncbi:diguanylate cyclase domain-containing protein [Vibrio algicola]|uniref:diguanylate cyclase n=1 Tax=Vibrio algicola TaxID=2662262 RepID=A0A5Q0TEI5_9VIBR|nr:diguanylate cyclase [Vibrio algicola]